MTCTRCGAGIGAGKRFCSRCGAPAAQQQPASSQSSRWLWAAALLALAAVAAALGYRLILLRQAARQASLLSQATEQAKPKVELDLPPPASPPEQTAGKPSPMPQERKPEAPPKPPPARQVQPRDMPLPAPPAAHPSAPAQKTMPEPQASSPHAAPSPETAHPAQAPAPDDNEDRPKLKRRSEEEAPAPAPPARPQRKHVEIFRPDAGEVPPPPRLPAPTAGSAASAPYQGPSAGTLIWSGKIEKNTLVTINGAEVSLGRLTGELPGVPVDIQPPDSFAVVEPPGPANHWKRLSLRSLKRIQSGVVIKWTVR
jgi:hypothetical protein